jgi:hypothetical protein
VQRGGDLARSGLRGLLGAAGHEESRAPAPSLSEVQLKEIWQHAYQSAIALRISDPKARLLADSLTGSLAVDQPG